MDAIRNSYEQIMNCPVGDLKFIESSQSMASSLGQLVEHFATKERKTTQTENMTSIQTENA